MEKKTILLTAGNSTELLALEKTLCMAGHHTLLAKNEHEAVKILESISLQLIVIKKKMEEAAGQEVMKHAFNLQPDAQRIMLIDEGDKERATLAMQEGHIHHFFITPWNDHQLSETITNSFIQYDLLTWNKQLQELLMKKHDAHVHGHQNMQRELPIETKPYESPSLKAMPKKIEDDFALIIVKGEKMMQSTYIKPSTQIACKSQYSYLKNIREFVAHLCDRGRGDKEALKAQMQLAMNEAFANIVEHSYKESNDGNITVKANFDDKGILFEISDQGNSFYPSLLEEPSFLGDKEDGFGWHIIKSIVDEIIYVPKRQARGWNHLRIYKLYFT